VRHLGQMPVPEVNGIFCSQPHRCNVRSILRPKPTPEPTPISSIGGITARGTPDSTGAGVIPPENGHSQIPANLAERWRGGGKTCDGPRHPSTPWESHRARIVDKCERRSALQSLRDARDVDFVVGISRKSSVAGKNRRRQNVAIGFVNCVQNQPVAHQAPVYKNIDSVCDSSAVCQDVT